MTQIFIPMLNQQSGEQASVALQLLATPQLDPYTERFCPTYKHPQRDEYANVFPVDWQIKIDKAADPAVLLPFLSEYVALGLLTEADLQLAAGTVIAMRGQVVTLFDVFPAYYKTIALTQEQAEADGWLASPF